MQPHTLEDFLDARLLATQHLALAIASLHCPDQETAAAGLLHVREAIDLTETALATLRELAQITASFIPEGATQ